MTAGSIDPRSEVPVSYFDHVQCPSCGTRMAPEQLIPGRGQMPACPSCRSPLNLTDLFGVRDAFVGLDDDMGNDHTLDDLVGGELYDSRYPDGRPPPREAPAREPVSPQMRAMVRHASSDSDPGEDLSAADLLRQMKRRR